MWFISSVLTVGGRRGFLAGLVVAVCTPAHAGAPPRVMVAIVQVIPGHLNAKLAGAVTEQSGKWSSQLRDATPNS